MKLRLCSVAFKQDMIVQINNHPKTIKAGRTINLIELGNLTEYDRDHFCGVVSEQIGNTRLIRDKIDDLEDMPLNERLEWFEQYFPNVDVVKIENSKLTDQIRQKAAGEASPSAVIVGAAELVWSK